MFLDTLALRQFRNFQDQNLKFNPEFNFIFGRNAQGKTNIMEAIYYLAELKSFRTSNKLDLIQKNTNFASIKAQFQKDELEWGIDIHLTQTERKVLLNDKKSTNRKQYFELIPLILFEPRHIYLFRDSPSVRRDYLNRALYLQDVSFLSLLRDYEKVISQKNRVLKEGGDAALIDVFNDQLVPLASQILHKRFGWLKSISVLLKHEYHSLSRTNEEFHLIYKPSQNLFEGQDDFFNFSLEDIQQAFFETLKQKRFDELQRRSCLVGPHRDDVLAYLDDRLVGDYGSQGENRSALIALKLAQLKLFDQTFQKTPLFLLDDVASELDERRCDYLFSYLRDESTQVFLTTTENRVENLGFEGHSSVFEVCAGGVKKIS